MGDCVERRHGVIHGRLGERQSTDVAHHPGAARSNVGTQHVGGKTTATGLAPQARSAPWPSRFRRPRPAPVARRADGESGRPAVRRSAHTPSRRQSPRAGPSRGSGRSPDRQALTADRLADLLLPPPSSSFPPSAFSQAKQAIMPTMHRSSCAWNHSAVSMPACSSILRYRSITASFGSGRRARLRAKYQHNSQHPGPAPGSDQSNRIVRPSGWAPRFHIFQSPCRKVTGVWPNSAASVPGVS